MLAVRSLIFAAMHLMPVSAKKDFTSSTTTALTNKTMNKILQELRKELIDKIKKTSLDSTSKERKRGFKEAKKVFINLIKEYE